MWLLKAWHKKTGLPVNNIFYFYLSRCHGTFTSRRAAYLQCSGTTHLARNILSGAQTNHWKFLSPRCETINWTQRSLFSTLYDVKVTPFSTCVKGNDKNMLSVYDWLNRRTPSASIHTSISWRDIPHYLQGNVSVVSSFEEDLSLDEYDEEMDNNMEDEIMDFLSSRLLLYEETESSFMLPCYSCSSDEQASRSQEIFIDKNSGYFVCPWCCKAGSWEELKQMLDQQQDTLTADQLSSYYASASDIAENHYEVLRESPLGAVSVTTLKEYGAKITNDDTQLIIPLKSESLKLVGFESVSLLHPVPQVVCRYVRGEIRPLFVVDAMKDIQKIVVVPNSCDALTLAEYKIHAIVLPQNNIGVLCDYLTSNKKEVYLWLGRLSPPRELLQNLTHSRISSWIVSCEEGDSPIHVKSEKEVRAALKKTIPVQSEATTTFTEIKDEIYRRLVNKEEIYGVQWKRYSELNSILLGHRQGEMTVLTGPTGSGKTTFMAEYSLDLCSQGVVTLWGSFEISIIRLCEIMLQQYSGTTLPTDSNDFDVLASKFSDLPLHFLTYHGQQTTKSVLEAMTKAVQIWGVQHVIIDNLQFMLGTLEGSADRWLEQDKTVAAFRRFATLNNCHVSLIVHPKKVPEGLLLSIDSVYGGAKVTQEADNVLILQVKESNTVNQPKKALQIVKNRYGGQLGILPLKFHKESLTLSSCFHQKIKSEKLPSSNKKEFSARQVKGLKAFTN